MLGIKGLIPPTVESLSTQMIRIMHQFRSRSTDLERYLYLRTLKNSNIQLFYRAVIDHMDEICPVIYTPTVGEACIKFSHIYNSGIVDGMYLSLEDRGKGEQAKRSEESLDPRAAAREMRDSGVASANPQRRT